MNSFALPDPVRLLRDRRLTSDDAGRRTVALGALAAALGVVVAVATYHGNAPGDLGLALLRAVLFALPIGVGLYVREHLPEHRFGRQLTAVGLLAFFATLSGAAGEVPYSIGRIAAWGLEVALVYLVLAFPSGSLHHRADRVIAAAILLLVVVLFVGTVPLVDSFPAPSTWSTCTTGCPGNAFQVITTEPAWVADVVVPLREALTSLLFLAVAARLLVRIARATTPMRRMLVPVLGGQIVHGIAFPIAFALRREGPDPGLLLSLVWLLTAGLPILALGFLAGTLRWRLAIAEAMYRLTPRLSAARDPAATQALLAEALEDPTVDVLYARAGGGWSDAQGAPATLPGPGSERACTLIRHDGAAVAAITHDELLADERGFVEALGTVAVMANTNQRLTSQVEASLREVRGSRERILAAADEERRRIERDLHDGAQQRLVALRIKLDLAAARSEEDSLPDAAQLRRLGEEAGEALDDVRSLAAGVYPALLVDGGLQDALRAVARRAPVATSVSAAGVGRHPPDVEAAVYFCCLEALQNAAKHARATAISVVIADGGALSFEVRDDGCGFDEASLARDSRGLTNIRDRIAAVGGELHIDSAVGHGTRVAGTIPLPVAR